MNAVLDGLDAAFYIIIQGFFYILSILSKTGSQKMVDLASSVGLSIEYIFTNSVYRISFYWFIFVVSRDRSGLNSSLSVLHIE